MAPAPPPLASSLSRLEKLRIIRSVECPACGEAPGTPCRSPGGTATGAPHQARYAEVSRLGLIRW